jgi:hypothetical protein
LPPVAKDRLEELRQLPAGSLLRSDDSKYAVIVEVLDDLVTALYYRFENDPLNEKWMPVTEGIIEWDIQNFWVHFKRIA